MDKKMYVFEYVGPVYIFETMVIPRIVYRTKAVSLRRAKSNIAFNIKKQLGRTASSVVNLPGKFTIIKEESKSSNDYTQIRMDI